MKIKINHQVLAAIALMTFTLSSYGASGDSVNTNGEVIKEIQIQNIASGGSIASSFYYFISDGDWQATNCPGVKYAYIDASAPGAQAVVSAALTSKTTNTPIKFGGICGNPSGNMEYIQIRHTYY